MIFWKMFETMSYEVSMNGISLRSLTVSQPRETFGVTLTAKLGIVTLSESEGHFLSVSDVWISGKRCCKNK